MDSPDRRSRDLGATFVVVNEFRHCGDHIKSDPTDTHNSTNLREIARSSSRTQEARATYEEAPLQCPKCRSISHELSPALMFVRDFRTNVSPSDITG
jgi:hypothetical protein